MSEEERLSAKDMRIADSVAAELRPIIDNLIKRYGSLHVAAALVGIGTALRVQDILNQIDSSIKN